MNNNEPTIPKNSDRITPITINIQTIGVLQILTEISQDNSSAQLFLVYLNKSKKTIFPYIRIEFVQNTGLITLFDIPTDINKKNIDFLGLTTSQFKDKENPLTTKFAEIFIFMFNTVLSKNSSDEEKTITLNINVYREEDLGNLIFNLNAPSRDESAILVPTYDFIRTLNL